MSKPQEFTIKVQSEDAKKKDKPLNDKANFEGSSKVLKDPKEDEGEELVCDAYSSCILPLIRSLHTVGGRPGFERTAGIAG